MWHRSNSSITLMPLVYIMIILCVCVVVCVSIACSPQIAIVHCSKDQSEKCNLARSLARSFVHSFVHSFIHSFIRPFYPIIYCVCMYVLESVHKCTCFAIIKTNNDCKRGILFPFFSDLYFFYYWYIYIICCHCDLKCVHTDRCIMSP